MTKMSACDQDEKTGEEVRRMTLTERERLREFGNALRAVLDMEPLYVDEDGRSGWRKSEVEARRFFVMFYPDPDGIRILQRRDRFSERPEELEDASDEAGDDDVGVPIRRRPFAEKVSPFLRSHEDHDARRKARTKAWREHRARRDSEREQHRPLRPPGG